MARNIRSTTLETRTQRLKLPVTPKPVFVRIGPGLSLGYRRNATAGSWVVRVADGARSAWTRNIGQADDHDPADGKAWLDFWQAQDRAKQVALGGGAGTDQDTIAEKPPTLRDALDWYESDLRARGGELKNATRVRRHLSAKLLDKLVADLTANDLRRWRDGLSVLSKAKVQTAGERPSAPATVNRTANALKACLNHAADRDSRISSRRPWEVGLASIRNAEQARNIILGDSDVRKLITAAYRDSEQFGILIEALATTGARISQLVGMRVADLRLTDANPRLMIPASRKGRRDKAVTRRPVPISEEFALKLWTVVASEKPGGELLFERPGGGPWGRSDHIRPFARIVQATGVAAAEGGAVSSYSLRHSSVVRQLLACVPARVVASMHDTSVLMLEKHYAAYIADHADALVRAALTL